MNDKKQKNYSLSDVKKALKERDSWWTVLVIDPIAIRFTYLFANYTSISPNLVSFFSLLASLVSSYLFFRGYLVYGAFVYELAFLLDCVDGKLASLTDRQSSLGSLFDRLFDRLRLFFNSAALGFVMGSFFLPFIFVFVYLWQESEGFVYRLKVKEEGLKGKPMRSFRDRAKKFFAKHRLVSFPDLVEEDTLVFFVGPLLKKPEFGFAAGIAVAIINITKWLVDIYLGNHESSR